MLRAGESNSAATWVFLAHWLLAEAAQHLPHRSASAFCLVRQHGASCGCVCLKKTGHLFELGPPTWRRWAGVAYACGVADADAASDLPAEHCETAEPRSDALFQAEKAVEWVSRGIHHLGSAPLHRSGMPRLRTFAHSSITIGLDLRISDGKVDMCGGLVISCACLVM